MAKVEKTAVESAQADLDAARKIENRFARIEAVQSAADALRIARSKAAK